MLRVYIGPNGYGKTTALESDKKDLINKGVPEKEILFLESEILLTDELKDSKDSTKTMEFIIGELLFNSTNVNNAKTLFEKAVDNEINSNQISVNNIVNKSLSLNGSSMPTGSNFITVTTEKEYKKLVKIDQKVFSKSAGSGQRMNFILRLVEASKTKKYVFLDEPEKYSHPSLLNETAKIINGIMSKGIDVYIATHSPKLLSMLDVDFSNLFVINDNSHSKKNIDFDIAISSLSSISTRSMKPKNANYYNKITLMNNIKQIHYRDFMETLFTKKVIICEGIDDECFIKRYLQYKNLYYEDYVIFITYGKYNMPVFCEIFKQLGIDFVVIFDEDNNSDFTHNSVNSYLSTYMCYRFVPNLEKEIGYSGDKNDINALNLFLDTFDFSIKAYF